MAQLRGHEVVHVQQNSGTPPTCFALPGAGGIAASWSNTNFDVHVAVYDDLSVYVGLNGNVNDSVVPNTYPVKMCVDENDWNWQWSGGELVGPSGSWKGSVVVGSNRSFVWNFSCGSPNADNSNGAGSGYVYVGQLDTFHGSSTGQDGYLYLSGTGAYEVDDPIYPDPVRITIPGFMQYLDYFPWATQDNGWKSCNRTGGFVQSYKDGSWQDRKNVAVGTGNNTVYRYDGSAWQVCPEIGDK